MVVILIVLPDLSTVLVDQNDLILVLNVEQVLIQIDENQRHVHLVEISQCEV
jgi:hypothetical protein